MISSVRPVATALAWLLATGLACSNAPTSPSPAILPVLPPPASPSPVPIATAPLPLGTASGSDVACPSGSPQGPTCLTVSIACPSAPATAHLRVERPRTPVRGTILLTTDGDGTLYARSRVHSPLAAGMIAQLAAAGLVVVEVAWRPGLWGGPRARTRACGFATAARWIYDHIHRTESGAVFIAQGTGAGASQIAFALAHYGAGSFIDLASLAGGPVACPLCTTDGATPFEPLLPASDPAPTHLTTFNYPATTVRLFIGDQESASVVAEARAFYGTVTSAKSDTVVSGSHEVEQSAAGVAALVSAALSARR